MPRLVLPAARAPKPTHARMDGGAGEPPRGSPTVEWLERVAKYIPGEVIAGYKGLLAVLVLVSDEDAAKVPFGWFAFVLCLALTPVYLNWMNKKSATPVTGRPLWVQLLIASVSFAVWAYALGGPFTYTHQPILLGGYREWMGGFFLIAYTLVIGAVYKP